MGRAILTEGVRVDCDAQDLVAGACRARHYLTLPHAGRGITKSCAEWTVHSAVLRTWMEWAGTYLVWDWFKWEAQAVWVSVDGAMKWMDCKMSESLSFF
ncbi:hypothetical protein BS78_04G103800 [Paspalum vaginatum]|nr:hypothetical protein BS78_04G103800 [Paspalum vaginatum]